MVDTEKPRTEPTVCAELWLGVMLVLSSTTMETSTVSPQTVIQKEATNTVSTAALELSVVG